MIDERPGGFRNEHLPAVAGARHPSGAMDVQAEIFVADEGGLAGVQADPYLDRRAIRPGVLLQSPLDGGRTGARLERAVEDDEEGIALGPKLVATVGGERLALDRVMGEEDIRVPLAELLDQPCRAFDIAEEEGDGAGWQRAHAGDAAPLNTGSSTLRSSSW